MNIFNINGFALTLDELPLYKNKVAKIKQKSLPQEFSIKLCSSENTLFVYFFL